MLVGIRVVVEVSPLQFPEQLSFDWDEEGYLVIFRKPPRRALIDPRIQRDSGAQDVPPNGYIFWQDA